MAPQSRRSSRKSEAGATGPRQPPQLRPFGLVLHRDGHWSHEGVPILNRRLRAAFDRSVRYLPDEGVYVVQLGRFRGQIEPEETAFFVRSFDARTGEIALSDRSAELLDVATLSSSPSDGALRCRIKRELAAGGLPARFTHAAQGQLLCAVDDSGPRPTLRVGGRAHALPADL